jgi:hypothetical protein
MPANPVFHAAQRIEKLAFQGDGCIDTAGDLVELDQRRPADGFDNIVVNPPYGLR